MLRKYIVYSAYYPSGQHDAEFALPKFQVLTVTTNPKWVKRLHAMWEHRLRDEAPAVRFLFTDFETIKKHGADFITLPIEDARGELHSIAPKS